MGSSGSSFAPGEGIVTVVADPTVDSAHLEIPTGIEMGALLCRISLV
jgi:hypothetical protein